MKALFTFSLLLSLFVGLSANAASEKTTFYHTDALGSIVAASDESGALLWKKTYDPYGNEVINNEDGEEFEGQAYTGKPYDKETGLLYLSQRYYDPQLRQFMSIDPVGFKASNPTSFNRYAYANNNPYKFIDPDGRESLFAFRQDQYQEEFGKGNITASQLSRYSREGGAGAAAISAIALSAVFGPQLALYIGTKAPAVTAFATELTAAEIGATTGSAYVAAKVALPIIRGTQRGGLNKVKVNEVMQDMLSGRFDFKSLKGQIGGFIDGAGRYHVGEGHNRMAAAMEIYKNTGNSESIKKLLQNGRWDIVKNAPINSRPLPSLSPMESFRNYIGF